MEVLSGKSVSNGIGIGNIIRVESIKEPSKGMVLNPSKEMANFDEYLKDLRNELLDLQSEYSDSELFVKLNEAANDKIWINEIKQYVGKMSMNLSYSIKSVSEKRGPYHLDNGYRLLRIINKIKPISIEGDEDVVVVARRLNMSDIMLFNEEIVKGIITEEGFSKENAISMPHVYDIDTSKLKGNVAIVDSDKSLVLIDQSEEIVEKYRQQIQINQIQTGGLTRYIGTETKTKDLKVIELSGILEKISDYDIIKSNDSDSVTILNENLFSDGKSNLSVEGQINICQKAFERFEGKYLNIRLTYSNDIACSNRLKALIMASKYGKVRIMLAGVYSIETLKAVRNELEFIEKKLVEEAIDFGTYQVGLIIETPEVVLMNNHMLELVDFFVVNSDRLLKHVIGDNENKAPSVYNIALLKLLKLIAINTKRVDKWVGIFGKGIEDKNIMQVLIGLDIDKFFIKSSQTLHLRKHIVKCEKKRLVENAHKALYFVNENELMDYLGRKED